MRTSAPPALASNRLFDDPGTRSMSPNEQKIASGRLAMATALSINSIGVTQTGQPGPCTSVICLGSRSSRPLLTMVWVWPPQSSMMVHGRVTFWRIAAASCSAAFASRYSLRNFTEFLFHCAQLFEVLEDAVRFVLVDDGDGESHVDENVLSDFGFRRVRQVDFFANAAEVDLADAECDVASVDDFDDTARNCQTHDQTSTGPQGLKPQMRSAPNAALKGRSSTPVFPPALPTLSSIPLFHPALSNQSSNPLFQPLPFYSACDSHVGVLALQSCHRCLPQRDPAIVGRDLPVRVYYKAA